MVIYVMRHAESLSNVGGRMISTTDMELTPKGLQQAEQAKRHVNRDFDFIFTSPLLRAKQTAEVMAGNAEIVVCDELVEMNLGALEGLTWEEIARDFPQIDTSSSLSATLFPQGESFNDTLSRCKNFIANSLSGLSGDASVLIVTHGITKRVLVNLLLERAPKWVDHLDWCDNTSYSVIELSPEASRLLLLNERRHLLEHGLGAEHFHVWSKVSDEDYTKLGG